MDENDYILMIQYSDKALNKIIDILRKEPLERTKDEENIAKSYILKSSRLLRKCLV